MKKAIAVLLSAAMIFSGICHMPAKEADAAAIRLNRTKVLLRVGGSYQLKLRGTKKSISWKSNRKWIASVNKKGIIKGKKKGTARITARLGKKKYVCRVTVKKQYTTSIAPTTLQPMSTPVTTPTTMPAVSTSPVTFTPIPTATTHAATEGATVTTGGNAIKANATATPMVTPRLPTYEPNQYSAKIQANIQKLSSCLLFTIKNNNKDWISNLDIHYILVNDKGGLVVDDTLSLGLIKGNETLQCAVPASKELLAQISVEDSYLYSYAIGTEEYHRYYDTKESTELYLGLLNKQEGTIPFSLHNKSALPSRGFLTLSMFDQHGTLVDALTWNYALESGQTLNTPLSVPYTENATGQKEFAFTDFSINYNAHFDNALNPQEEQAKSIFVTPQLLKHSLLLTVANQNELWFDHAEVQCTLRTKEDEVLTTVSGSLLSIAPDETQHVAIPVDAQVLRQADLHHSQTKITPYTNEAYTFEATEKLMTTVQVLEDQTRETVLSNPLNQTVTGSYIVYFYQGSTIVDAEQSTFSLEARETLHLPIALTPDETEGEITCRAETTGHIMSTVKK